MYNIMASQFVTNAIDLLKPSVKNTLCIYICILCMSYLYSIYIYISRWAGPLIYIYNNPGGTYFSGPHTSKRGRGRSHRCPPFLLFADGDSRLRHMVSCVSVCTAR